MNVRLLSVLRRSIEDQPRGCDGMFTEDQRDLLFTLVEASRRVKSEFIVVLFHGGQFVRHAGLGEKNLHVYLPDLTALRNEELFTVTRQKEGGGYNFDIAPRGIAAYEELHTQLGSATDAVEQTMRRYLDSDEFRRRYPNSDARWTKASEVLWSANPEGHLSEVGHYCREAMQEFAEELLAEHQLAPQDVEKQHTVARIKQLLSVKKAVLGETVSAWLDAMLAYWGTVADLSQRQEHAAQKDGEELKWDDARRLVFQSISLMYEMSDALAPYRESAVGAQVAEDRDWLTNFNSQPHDFIPEEVSREKRMRETRLDRNFNWLKEVGIDDGWV